jgi:O-antigen/teichoic acid export membrane protein
VISTPTLRNAVFVLGGNAVKLGLGFVATAGLARAIGPAEFGVYSLAMNLLLVISSAGDLGLNTSFVRLFVRRKVADQADAQMFLRRMVALRLSMSTGLFLLCLLALPLAGVLIVGESVPPSLLRIGSLVVLTDGLFMLSLALLQAEEKFGKLSALNVVINVLRVILLAAFYFSGALTAVTAILTVVLSSFAVASIVFLTERGYRPALAVQETLRDVKGLFFWGRWLSLMAIANILYVRLDMVLLGYFHIDRSAVGNYALAYAFAWAVVAFQVAMMTLLLPKVSSINTAEKLRIYLKRASILAVVAIPALLIFCVAVDFFLGWFYGNQYPEAATVFPYLAAGFAVTLITTPFIALSMTLDRPQILAYENILGLVIVLILGLLLIPTMGIIGCALSVLLSRIVMETAAVASIFALLRRKGWVMARAAGEP